MWEERALTNTTPDGLSPERKFITTRNKPITKEDDRLPAAIMSSTQGDITLQKRGDIGNGKLLQSSKADPEEERNKLKGFPSPTARDTVEKVLKKFKQIAKRPFPACVAITIWGTDNLHKYGKSMAQVFELLGVRYNVDDDEFKLIPLEELGRPRIDCIISCSGVFRDLFTTQMMLMDRAIKFVADAKEAPGKYTCE